MKNAKALYTMFDWESLCSQRLAYEPENYRFPRLVPIECPNVLHFNSQTDEPRMCLSKLWDDKLVFAFGDRLRRVVRCQVCGWSGTRALGKDD